MTTNNSTSSSSSPISKPVTDDAILKVTKEIVIKFIEVGRLTTANFDEIFKRTYKTVHDTVRSS